MSETTRVKIKACSTGSLLYSLRKSGIVASLRAKDMIQKVNVPQEVTLVTISVKDLGYKSSAKRRDIYESAFKQGLCECPVSAALSYLQGDNLRALKVGETLVFGINPYKSSDGDLNLLIVERCDNGELRLYAGSGEPEDSWNNYTSFVFMSDSNAN